MSNQLSISYPVQAAHLYCVVRTRDGGVWNVSTGAFETPSNTLLVAGDYTINLADLGLDLYGGDMPSAIPTGAYRIYFYERAGASPATSDIILISPTMYWNGSTLREGSGPVAPSDPVVILDATEGDQLNLIAGDDYTVGSRVPTWTITGYDGPSLAGTSGVLRLLNARDFNRIGSAAAADLEANAAILQVSDTVTIAAPLSAAQTTGLSIISDDGITHFYQIIASVAGKPNTLKTGPTVVSRTIQPKG